MKLLFPCQVLHMYKKTFTEFGAVYVCEQKTVRMSILHVLIVDIDTEMFISSCLRWEFVHSKQLIRFEVFTTIEIQVQFFWVVTPCSVVVGYQRFGGPCCLHLQGEVTMEAAEYSETLTSYITTQRYNSQDHVLGLRHDRSRYKWRPT
jgi:hypothetical protein